MEPVSLAAIVGTWEAVKPAVERIPWLVKKAQQSADPIAAVRGDHYLYIPSPYEDDFAPRWEMLGPYAVEVAGHRCQLFAATGVLVNLGPNHCGTVSVFGQGKFNWAEQLLQSGVSAKSDFEALARQVTEHARTDSKLARVLPYLSFRTATFPVLRADSSIEFAVFGLYDNDDPLVKLCAERRGHEVPWHLEDGRQWHPVHAESSSLASRHTATWTPNELCSPGAASRTATG